MEMIHREQPRCPHCGDVIEGLYSNDTSVNNDGLIMWKWHGHRCPGAGTEGSNQKTDPGPAKPKEERK